MSTAFAAKNGLTFTKYLCLFEFISKYPSTFLITLSLIIKTFLFSCYLSTFDLLHHLMIFLLSSIVKYYFVVVVVVAVVVVVVTVVVLSKFCLRCANLLLVSFCSVRLLVKLFLCFAPGLALISSKTMLLSFSELILEQAKAVFYYWM